MSKKLIINADDYGLCREVNRAIEDLVSLEKLKNVSVLANSWLYEETAGFLLEHPFCCAGIHLNIVEGIAASPNEKVKALLNAQGEFLSLNQMLLRWMRAPFAVSKAVELEWRAQIELMLKDGLAITHADSHQHIHAFPPFWRILVKLCREYGIAAARLPRERNKLKFRKFAAFALGSSATISKTLWSGPGIAVNDHFLGFKRAGYYREDEMVNDIKDLKDGVTEITVHPSLDDGVPYPHFHGEMEYRALQGSKIWKQIEDSNVELVTWKDISRSAVPAARPVNAIDTVKE
jgi:predicted glycoside hydrolase/deacetylase ChbG (UPF0249 family)